MVSTLYENNRVCNLLCDALQCLVMCQQSANGNTVTDHDSQGWQADKHRKVGTLQAVREAKTTRGSSLIKREPTLLINRGRGFSSVIPSLSQEARWTSYTAATPVAFSTRSTTRGSSSVGAVPCCRCRHIALLRLLWLSFRDVDRKGPRGWCVPLMMLLIPCGFIVSFKKEVFVGLVQSQIKK